MLPLKLLLPLILLASPAAANSVLQQGRWLKLQISATGIHKISAEQAQKWNLGNLDAISIWGSNAANLPRSNREPYPTDLQQIPSIIHDGNLLFYAQASVSWHYSESEDFFNHELNEFSQTAYIYITNSQPPSRISQAASIAANHFSSAYDLLTFHERNDTNLLRSGRRFWGEIFGITRERIFPFDLPNVLTNAPVRIKVAAAAKSSAQTSLTVQIGSQAHALDFHANANSSAFAIENAAIYSFSEPTGDKISIKLAYQRPDNASSAFLDFITINARSKLALNRDQLVFRDAQSVAPERITQFSVETNVSNVQIWDVSDIYAPARLQTTRSANAVSVSSHTDNLKTFAAFSPEMAYSPTFVEKIANQNLQGMPYADNIIITAPPLIMMAERLANLHAKYDSISTIIVTTDQIYNEYSAGIADPSAIRNFLKHKKAMNCLPKSALLLGSGSYVNMSGKRGAGLIPTYQSDNSLEEHNSFVSDDYFALLDENETLGNSGMTGDLDLAIGRLPAANAAQASAIVHKIERHYSAPRCHTANQFVIIADDGDNNLHIGQAEDIANFVQDSFPQYPVQKIFFDKYPMQLTAVGPRFPAVTEAIASAVSAGALLINYVGHANTQWLAHEQVLTQADIAAWQPNNRHLPLFVTATCEFSRFDTWFQRSAGENILLHAGGGIAMLSTTRLVYSNGNERLNKEFMRQLFMRDNYGKPLALGEIVRRSKNNSRTGVNQLNFTLLGDPALRLNLHSDSLTSHLLYVDGIETDTLRALSRVNFIGSADKCADGDTIEVAVYAQKAQRQTLGSGSNAPFIYSEHPFIYKGLAHMNDGAFSVAFAVPQDIVLSYGIGKITYYGKCGSRWVGGSLPIVVGGVSSSPCDANEPSIRAFMDDESFIDGGSVSQNAVFHAIIETNNGISISGVGIGRSITLTLLESGAKYILNDYYSADAGSQSIGSVYFPLPHLAKGRYTAVFKVWDACANSAQCTLRFVVEANKGFTIANLYNFPNPFSGNTTFFFSHNRQDAEMEIEIMLFGVNGSVVRILNYVIYGADTEHYNNYAVWNGRNISGAACSVGIYGYRLTARTRSDEKAVKHGKMLYLGW